LAEDDRNPERLRLTTEVRRHLDRLAGLESSLPAADREQLNEIRANIAEYLDWNETDAMPVRQNMALRNDETGERR